MPPSSARRDSGVAATKRTAKPKETRLTLRVLRWRLELRRRTLPSMVTCPSRGRQSPEDFAFCPACAAPLAPVAPREVPKLGMNPEEIAKEPR